MKLYHDPRSRSVRPLVLLEELGIPYEVVPVSLEQGEHKSASHLELHPLGQLPVLVDGDTPIFESVAICLYLVDRHPDSGLIPVSGSPERGLYYQWCAFVTGSLEPALFRVFTERQGGTPVPGIPALEDVFAALSRPLENQEYLLASGYSAADVLIGSTLVMLPRMGVELPPTLSAYAERLMARPAFRTCFGDSSATS